LRNAYFLKRVNQTLANTTSAALKDAYVKNNAFVGYSKVGHGDNAGETLDITMVPVFGATGITIKNTGTDTYKIEKIVLRGNDVYNKATIDPTACTEDVQYSSNQVNFVEQGMGLVKENTFNVAQYVASTSERYYGSSSTKGSAAKSYDANWSGYNRVAALKDVLTYENAGDLQVVIAAGNTVRPQGEINVIAMLRPMDVEPAIYQNGNWSKGNEVVLDIHTDKGLIRDIKLNYHYTSTNGSMEDDASITNVLTDKAIAKLGDGKSIKVTFDDTSLDTPKEMVINKNDELANLIHWNANSSAPIKANLKSNVTITKSMYNELAASQIGTATIYGDASSAYKVTIASDVPAGALDRFTFVNIGKVEVLGTQTLAVEKTVPVYNYGTLNVTGNKAYSYIQNEGTLNINTKMSTAVEYDTDGNVVTPSKIVNTHDGVINVASGKEMTTAVAVTNGCSEWWHNAVINNAGVVRKLTNNIYATVHNTGVIGTEKQVGDITEDVDNYGTINNNEGKVFVNVNSGSVYANGKSTTRMETNNGYIIITNLDENDGNFLASIMGNIVQEISAPANTDAVDVRANMIWLSSTLKVEKKNADGEYVDVNLNKTAKNGQVRVVATGKNARIDGNGQKLTMSHITVNGGAKLVLNKVDVFNYVPDGSSYAYIYMKGNSSDGVATITINNNASLTSNVEIYATNENAWNVIDNNSNSTTIGVDTSIGNI